MKVKIFSILLITSLVVPITACFVMLHVQKKQIRKEVKWNMIAGLDQEELVHLKFSEEEKKTALRWEHEREFEYQGEMYDLVESKVVGDTTYYTLWHDHAETRLNKQLDVLVEFALGKNPGKQENEKKLQDFFKSLYSNSYQQSILAVFPEFIEHCSTEENIFRGRAHSPTVPPPEKV